MASTDISVTLVYSGRYSIDYTGIVPGYPRVRLEHTRHSHLAVERHISIPAELEAGPEADAFRHVEPVAASREDILLVHTEEYLAELRAKPVRVPSDCDVALDAGTSDAEYLRVVRDCVPRALDDAAPGIVLFVAGADVLAVERNTRLALTVDGLVERDVYVVSEARRRGIPVAVVLAGCYSPTAVDAQARSLRAIASRLRSTG